MSERIGRMKSRHVAVVFGVLIVIALCVATLSGGGQPIGAPGNQDVFAGPGETDPLQNPPLDDAITAWTEGGRVPAAEDPAAGGGESAAPGAASTDTGWLGTGGGSSDLPSDWSGFGGDGGSADFGEDWWDFLDDEFWNSLGDGGGSGEGTGDSTGEGTGDGDGTGAGEGEGTGDGDSTGGGGTGNPDDGTQNNNAASGRPIVFTATQDGNQDIYAVGTDGQNQVRLTDDPATDRHPAWSPDGSKVAFVSDRNGSAEIFVMNQDGTAATPLTSGGGSPAHPSWAPDGQRIAFEGTDPASGGREIFAVSVSDGSVERLTSDACAPTDGRSCPDGEVGNRQPAFSPDGSQIAFVRGEGNAGHLYLMGADGSGARRAGGSRAANPAWNGNGNRIAYDDVDGIRVLDVSNTESVLLPGPAAPCLTDGQCPVLFEPSWGPTGAQLVVRDASAGATSGDLWVTDLLGQNKTRLTTGLGAASPHWG